MSSETIDTGFETRLYAVHLPVLLYPDFSFCSLVLHFLVQGIQNVGLIVH